MLWPNRRSRQLGASIAIGLTRTAVGTPLPILRATRCKRGVSGAFIMVAGAVGEFLPIMALAVFRSANGAFG